jgi:carbamoyltransferase
VANGKVLRDGRFEEIWIQPAAGDAGGALGAALAAYHGFASGQRVPLRPDAMQGGFLGPAFDDDAIAARLEACGARFERLDEGELLGRCTRALIAGEALGWFQGRMEFGPRALGARSILGDPRVADMQRRLNLKIKHRESFRPFAPSVLAEDARDWFELDAPSPYMMLVANVLESRRRGAPLEGAQGFERINAVRSEIPAVTHIDHSARVQTVHRDTNPRFHALLSRFKAQTGCPVLVNTSFNVRGEPIVCTPEDAFRCFMGTDIDALAVGNCFLAKRAQDAARRHEPARAFEPD